MWSRLFMRTGLTFAPRSTMEYFGSTFCSGVTETWLAAGMERPPAAGPAHAANTAQQTTIETRCVMYPPNVERRLASRQSIVSRRTERRGLSLLAYPRYKKVSREG